MALTSPRAAFFDVDNTLVRGSTLYFLGRGMYQRGFFTKADISRFVVANIRFRMTGTEKQEVIAKFQKAAQDFIGGHSVTEIKKIGEEIYDEFVSPKIWQGTFEIARSHLDRGEEGGILKSLNGIWEAKRSKYQLKLKAEDPADLLVVGYTLGTPGTQFDGMLGALVCQTSCGQLEVSVGSGFKHKKGERDNPESYIGKIIQVKYNCIISSKGSDKKSMFLPIFDGIRYDKDTANSLEDLS